MTEQALASLCEALEQGKSDELANYLDVMSRFPKYSFRNFELSSMSAMLFILQSTLGAVPMRSELSRMRIRDNEENRSEFGRALFWPTFSLQDKARHSNSLEYLHGPVSNYFDAVSGGLVRITNEQNLQNERWVVLGG